MTISDSLGWRAGDTGRETHPDFARMTGELHLKLLDLVTLQRKGRLEDAPDLTHVMIGLFDRRDFLEHTSGATAQNSVRTKPQARLGPLSGTQAAQGSPLAPPRQASIR